jgi:hypothetical protein
MVKINTKKSLVTSLIFILNWIRFMMISKIEIRCFQINLMLEFLMWLKVELL